jgi:hypothetical protein
MLRERIRGLVGRIGRRTRQHQRAAHEVEAHARYGWWLDR